MKQATFFASRPSRSLLAAAAFAGLMAAGGVHAQGYTGPGAAAPAAVQQGYAGPSSLSVITVKELLEHGKDDQKAILRGRIVSSDGGEHYTFDDGTGTIRVEIDNEDFPQGRTIDDKTIVELIGELDRDRSGVEFEVDRIRLP